MVTAVKKSRRLSRGDRVFDAVNYAVMGIFLVVVFYPLYYTLIASLSDINEVGLGRVFLWPKGFTLDSYRQVFNYAMIWTGYANSLIYTALGIAYNLALLLPLAYALSKRYLWGRGPVTWFFLFTMYFGGGIIPNYLLRTQTLHINNTVWVMILGGASVYYVIVTRTFFANIPGELYESAEMDGASQFRCFFQIALPLSAPIIAVIALFLAVDFWNSYFNAMIYITKRSMYPLQLVLRSILILNDQISANPDLITSFSADEMKDLLVKQRLAQSMKYSTIFIGSAPLLIAYPFVQKYFVKGMMIGSVKG
ncbi:MAG: carbohydrate ABC transporter permease [Clostridiales bacterium]|jgi:putative aldouronate transport system permease protein|nr:carbohydrate ABC transporter permease [Clostridiales bacterium]